MSHTPHSAGPPRTLAFTAPSLQHPHPGLHRTLPPASPLFLLCSSGSLLGQVRRAHVVEHGNTVKAPPVHSLAPSSSIPSTLQMGLKLKLTNNECKPQPVNVKDTVCPFGNRTLYSYSYYTRLPYYYFYIIIKVPHYIYMNE